MVAAVTRYYIRLRLRWWVKPYMAAVSAFIWSVAWALDGDDPRLGAFVQRQAKFISESGIKISFVKDDPGDQSSFKQFW